MESKRSQKGSDNVLIDLGFEDAEELSAKATLAVKFNELLEKRELSQTEAAVITGMTQPKVSQVRRYKLQNISLSACRRSYRSTSVWRSSFGRHVAHTVPALPSPRSDPTTPRRDATLRARWRAGCCLTAAQGARSTHSPMCRSRLRLHRDAEREVRSTAPAVTRQRPVPVPGGSRALFPSRCA